MTEADFTALNEHLEEVRPIFEDFCHQHEFVFVPRLALGRYPRIRIERAGAVKIWYDLSMQVDGHGRRYEKFRRDLPYELSAGAYVDERDGSGSGLRFQKAFPILSSIPFHEVSAVLFRELQNNLPTLERWDVPHMKARGRKVHLRA